MIEVQGLTERYADTVGVGAGGASRRRARLLFFLVASLAVAVGIGLSASLHFPEVLLDNRSFATSLVASSAVTVVLSLSGLLACGVLMVMLSRALVPLLPEGGRRPLLLLGGAAGCCWGTSATLGLVLVPMWANGVATGVSLLAGIAFVSATIGAPLLLAGWTVRLVRQFRSAGVAGVVGVLGLLAIFARSSVWALDTLLPEDEGFYLASAVLTLLALLGYPAWVYWLFRMGVLLARPGQASGPSRPIVLAVARRLGAGLLGAVFALAHAGVMIISTPTPKSDDVPSVPSAAGAVRYTVMLALSKQFALPASNSQLLAQRQDEFSTPPEVPRGATLKNVDAGGVPAEYICAAGASYDHVALYIPGGGFTMPPGNGSRTFAANVSRESGACVLMPHYRLAPEHPFPAAVRDCVTAYRWLRRQGIAASRTAIFGDSAGGNLTLATALSLRDSGDALPAALVPVSAVTDFTLSGKTFRTKADRDPLLTRGPVNYTLRSYAESGAVDLRDPLLSPLYANLNGLPPTLLMVGSQEVLLSDSIRMADRLRSAGVPVKLEIWPGMPHSWNGARKETMETRLAVQHIAAFIARRMS